MLSALYSKLSLTLAGLARIGGGLFADLSGATLAYIYVLALCIVFIRVWWVYMEHRRKGEEVETFLKVMRFFGKDLAIAALVVSGGLLPMAVSTITPHPWPMYEKIGHSIAQIGDELWISTQRFVSLQGGGLADFQERSSAYNAESGLTNQINAAAVATALQSAQSELATVRDQIAALEISKQDRQRAGLAWTKTDDTALAAKRASYNIAAEKYKSSDAAFSQANTALQAWQAQKQADYNSAKTTTNQYLDMVAQDHDFGPPSWLLAQLAKVGMSVGTFVADGAPSAWDILSHVGFYAALAPALLGLLGGLIMLFKAALSSAQTGLKFQIMRNLGFGLASVFAPLFFLGFFFKNTERFAWKLVDWMFSAFFTLFALKYFGGIIGATATKFLKGLVANIDINSAASFAKEASWPLFWNSCQIGIWGIAVGMTAQLLVDLVKSGASAGNGLYAGNFNVS
jgi:hypothetical protein